LSLNDDFVLVARDPARWDEAEWGFFRWGVYTDRWERTLGPHMRTLYRGILNTEVAPDSTTGRREPVYTNAMYQEIKGLLVEKNMSSIHLPAGVVGKLDATLILFAGMFMGDHVWAADSEKEYYVADIPVEHTDPDVGGLAFRECHLVFLPFFKHPTT